MADVSHKTYIFDLKKDQYLYTLIYIYYHGYLIDFKGDFCWLLKILNFEFSINQTIYDIKVVLMIGTFIGFFGETALNMALTDIMGDFSISAGTAQWITTGYLLVLAILVPLSAYLVRWFSHYGRPNLKRFNC